MATSPRVSLVPFTADLLTVVQPCSAETPESAVEPGPAMGLAYVVDPRQWRRGYGTATLRAAMDAPEVADVVVFAAGIEPDNIASARCAVKAGLVPDNDVPDWEGMVHHTRRREINAR